MSRTGTLSVFRSSLTSYIFTPVQTVSPPVLKADIFTPVQTAHIPLPVLIELIFVPHYSSYLPLIEKQKNYQNSFQKEGRKKTGPV